MKEKQKVNKDLSYYLSQEYEVKIVKISENDGGGYYASYPELGEFSFRADGETKAEALENLENSKEDLFQYCIDNNIELPAAAKESEEEYSGRFVTRIPKFLHRDLVLKAKEQGCSLNSLVQVILAAHFTEQTNIQTWTNKIQDNIINHMKEELTIHCSSFIRPLWNRQVNDYMLDHLLKLTENVKRSNHYQVWSTVPMQSTVNQFTPGKRSTRIKNSLKFDERALKLHGNN